MSFLEFDYDVVRGCVANRRYAWEEFVDRFMDLTLRVMERAAERKSIRLDDEQKIELCEAIFRALDCGGLARVDFFYTRGEGEFVFNEINTLPGFTPISMYPKMMINEGISYSELLDRLIQTVL